MLSVTAGNSCASMAAITFTGRRAAASGGSPKRDNVLMIDRQARTEMCKVIRDYMAERIGALELGDELHCIAHATQDGTVKFVNKLMWYHYDDCKDHKIVASKQRWDYFNRLLLLLESEAEGDFVRVRSSWRAEWHRFFHGEKPTAAEIAVTPFPSISSLLAIRRSVEHFVRARYPKKIAGRRIRNFFVEGVLWIPWTIVRLINSPVFLLIQLLRPSYLEPRIRIPSSS